MNYDIPINKEDLIYLIKNIKNQIHRDITLLPDIEEFQGASEKDTDNAINHIRKMLCIGLSLEKIYDLNILANTSIIEEVLNAYK